MDMSDEVAFRVPILKSEASVLRRIVFGGVGGGRLSTGKRLHIAQAYVFSKGLFQAGSWPKLPVKLFAKIHCAIMYVYRCVAGKRFSPDLCISDDAFLAEFQPQCPMTLLRQLRLMLFFVSAGLRMMS